MKQTKTNCQQTPQESQFQQVLMYRPDIEKPGVRTAFRKKFLEWLEASPAKKIILKMLEMFSILSLSALFFFPQHAGSIVLGVILAVWRVVLAVAIVQIVKHWKAVRRAFRRWRLGGNQHTLEGVPKSELLHLLFETNGFRLEDAKKLGMNRKRYDSLAKRLEHLGVLVRGEKNARVLSPSYSREQIQGIIEEPTRAEEIRYHEFNPEKKPFWKKIQVQEMVQKENEAMLTPSPFTIRKIA